MIERRIGEYPPFDTRAEANESVDRTKRYAQIIECLKEGGRQTAKEIAMMMCRKGYIPYSERNFTAPRLTELSQRGVVEAVGTKKCQWTGKTVSVYALCEKQENLFGV